MTGSLLRTAAVLFALTACDAIPKDPEGTLERVRGERAFRVGLIASGPDRPQAQEYRSFLTRVARRTGARPLVHSGPAERLLTEVEQGELDLVVGELSAKSPWSKQVTLLPLRTKAAAPGEMQPTAVARNGENGWIALLYREAEAVKGGGG